MSALSLSGRSALRRARDYYTHLAAVALNALLYYLFVAVKRDPVVRAGALATSGMPQAFAAASVVVAIFAGAFLWFATSYYLRRRKREAGLYALFGSPRASVGLGLFAEMSALGLAATAIGIGAGCVLSRLFLLAVFRLVGASVGPGALINPSAMAETAAVFAVLVAVTSLGAFVVAYRSRLAALFSAARTAEAMPRPHPLLAIASVALLVAGYAYALGSTMSTVGGRFFIVVGITTAATYGIVRFTVPMALRALRAREGFFLRSWRPLALGNLSFRIGNNVRIFFAIAMIGTVSMAAIGTGVNLKYDTQRRAETEFPFTLALTEVDGSELGVISSIAIANGINPVVASARVRHASLSLAVSAGGAPRAQDFLVVPASEFAAARAAAGLDAVGLPAAGEAILLLTRSDRLAEAEGAALRSPDGLELRIAGTARGAPVGGWSTDPYIVASDGDFEALVAPGVAVRTRLGVTLERPDDSTELTRAVISALPGRRVSSRAFDVETLQRSNDLFLFIGVFIGLVFLASTGSVIHFKQVMEIGDDAPRYAFLSTIGIEPGILSRAVKAQVLATYAVPLALGVIHSVVALATMGRVFQSDFSRPIALTIAGYCAVYLVLYLASSKAAVRAALGKARIA